MKLYHVRIVDLTLLEACGMAIWADSPEGASALVSHFLPEYRYEVGEAARLDNEG